MEQLAEISSKYQTVKPVRTGMYVYALGSQAQATGTAPCRHSTATENDGTGTRHLSRSRIALRARHAHGARSGERKTTEIIAITVGTHDRSQMIDTDVEKGIPN